MPASRARYDDERHGRSVARGTSMPAWRAQDRRDEESYQPVSMRVFCSADRSHGMKRCFVLQTVQAGGPVR